MVRQRVAQHLLALTIKTSHAAKVSPELAACDEIRERQLFESIATAQQLM